MRIRYFSWLRSKTGVATESIDLPQGCDTIGALIRHLSGRYPAFAEIAEAQGSLRYTVNQRYVDHAHAIHPTDTVNFFPPVTGG
jgi:sulfur-carrier protein